jgi:hypothetical protein
MHVLEQRVDLADLRAREVVVLADRHAQRDDRRDDQDRRPAAGGESFVGEQRQDDCANREAVAESARRRSQWRCSRLRHQYVHRPNSEIANVRNTLTSTAPRAA